MLRRSVVTGAALAFLAAYGTAFAQGVPKEMSWTAYDTGSSGFNIAVAIGQQFKNALGADVRVLPSGNDTGRLGPVKANRAVISQMGIGTYFAQEGVFEFGTRSWGPQATRLIMAADRLQRARPRPSPRTPASRRSRTSRASASASSSARRR